MNTLTEGSLRYSRVIQAKAWVRRQIFLAKVARLIALGKGEGHRPLCLCRKGWNALKQGFLREEANAMPVKTRKSLLKTVVIVALVALCGSVSIANAGNLGDGSYYLFLSNTYGNLAHMYGEYGLYYESYDYLYYAYTNLNNAATYASYACLYCYYGYSNLGSTNAYYAYLYAYYNYLYASNAATYTYYCYSHLDYSGDAISNTYQAQYYNSLAAYYAGLASYNGTY